MDRWRPLAGVTIGICQADRSAGKFLGPYQIDTDAEGRFTLANLPPKGDLFVYGIMDSLKDGRALPTKKFTPATGNATELGDLSTVAGNSIRGRIVLADRKPIPPKTRIMFNRESAWDSKFVEAAADGSFSIDGIPPEVIDVIVQVKGYRLSPKNKSFEPLNGSGIKGKVSGNVEDLIILYEPGETIRPDYDRNWQITAEKHNRLGTQRLAGVTAALAEFPPGDDPASADGKQASDPLPSPAPKQLPKILVPPKEPVPPLKGGPTKTLTGSVQDGKGQSVKGGQVWLPVRWLNPWENLTATSKLDESARFRLTFPEAWIPHSLVKRNHIVWAYAPGYAIGTGGAYQELFGSGPPKLLKIEVPPAGDLSFVVLLPNGKPAVGAKVEPTHFKTQRLAGDMIPRELVDLIAAITDSAGRAAIPALTRDGVSYIDVKLAGFGTQQFRCDGKSTDPAERTLQLRSVGRLVGHIATDQLKLTHDMIVWIETSDLQIGLDLRQAKGTAQVKVDNQGRFEVPEIAHGRVEVMARCDERLPVRPRLPERGTLTLLDGETRKITIPLEMAIRVKGVVRAKDTQKPLAGVTVHVGYSSGGQSDQAITDVKGEYSAFGLPGKVRVQLLSIPNEYIQLGEPWNEAQTVPADAQEFTWPTIDVVPSIKIEGKILDREGKALANVDISGIVGNRRYGFGKSDKNGIFTLHAVPKDIRLEEFEILTRDERFTGRVETREPLVVRVQK
jgi:hypothetical protein